MRRFFEKFGLLMQVVLSSIFVLFIILLLTGALDKADFHNSVVYILFGTFIALELIFSAILLYIQYTADVVSTVAISNGQFSGVKASIVVIRKTVQAAVKGSSGVKVSGIKVSINERGLKLHLKLRLKERSPERTIEPLRLIIAEAFRERLGLEFCYIDFVISSMRFKDAGVKSIDDISVSEEPISAEPISEEPEYGGESDGEIKEMKNVDVPEGLYDETKAEVSELLDSEIEEAEVEEIAEEAEETAEEPEPIEPIEGFLEPEDVEQGDVVTTKDEE